MRYLRSRGMPSWIAEIMIAARWAIGLVLALRWQLHRWYADESRSAHHHALHAPGFVYGTMNNKPGWIDIER